MNWIQQQLDEVRKEFSERNQDFQQGVIFKLEEGEHTVEFQKLEKPPVKYMRFNKVKYMLPCKIKEQDGSLPVPVVLYKQILEFWAKDKYSLRIMRMGQGTNTKWKVIGSIN